jgi:excinuclease UvrABC nuclease subunit
MLSKFFESCLATDLTAGVERIDEQLPVNGPLAPLPTCKGVLLFADADDRPIQLLIAANIRRTAMARLLLDVTGETSKKSDLTAIVRKIYYSRCYNDLRSSLTHYNAARLIYPKEYRKMLKLPRQCYVRIDILAEWPIFQTTEKVSDAAGEKVFGPFPTRRSANDFIQILQNAFDLCQMPQLIAHRRKAASCSYLQMKTCPAPCMGQISRQEYLNQISAAIDAASGNIENQKTVLTQDMQLAADRMDFEKAQHIKKQMAQLDLLGKEKYRWTGQMASLNILHIDRSAKVSVKKRKKMQLFTAFVINAGGVFEIGDFSLESMDDLHETVTRIDTGQKTCSSNELLAIVGYHLYRSNPRGVWINCSYGPVPTGEEIGELIRKRFDI